MCPSPLVLAVRYLVGGAVMRDEMAGGHTCCSGVAVERSRRTRFAKVRTCRHSGLQRVPSTGSEEPSWAERERSVKRGRGGGRG